MSNFLQRAYYNAIIKFSKILCNIFSYLLQKKINVQLIDIEDGVHRLQYYIHVNRHFNLESF